MDLGSLLVGVVIGFVVGALVVALRAGSRRPRRPEPAMTVPTPPPPRRRIEAAPTPKPPTPAPPAGVRPGPAVSAGELLERHNRLVADARRRLQRPRRRAT